MSVNWNKVRQPFQQVQNWLTSMRTVLVLLFILALAAVPGVLLPQRSLNRDKVDQYLAANGKIAEIMDKLQFSDVFSAVWFVTIAVLSLISLVGCIILCTTDRYKAMKTPPVGTPKRLARLPLHDEAVVDASVGEVSERVHERLNKWALTETPADEDHAGAHSFSVKKGYLREFDNLVLHLGIALPIIIVAWGRMTYCEGQVILLVNTGAEISDDDVNSAVGISFCNTAAANYDSLRSGNIFGGMTLNSFCIQVEGFAVDYPPNGQVRMFISHIRFTEEEDMRKLVDEWEKTMLQVNHPLRIAGDRVYLQGHGFAPVFKVTWPSGESRTLIVQFRPDDPTSFPSSGALRFDPPAGMCPDLFERRQNQIAIEGLFAPIAEFTGEKGALLQSPYLAMQDSTVAVNTCRGDAGLDIGRPQGPFSLDRDLMYSGQLAKEARVNLKRGESTEFADGTEIEFLGAKEFVNIQISHDPTRFWVLMVTLVVLVGMVMSLGIKYRRVRARMFPLDDGRTCVGFDGPACIDKAGWGKEFQYIVGDILERDSGNEDATDQDTADIDAADNGSDDVDSEGKRVKN